MSNDKDQTNNGHGGDDGKECPKSKPEKKEEVVTGGRDLTVSIKDVRELLLKRNDIMRGFKHKLVNPWGALYTNVSAPFGSIGIDLTAIESSFRAALEPLKGLSKKMIIPPLVQANLEALRGVTAGIPNLTISQRIPERMTQFSNVYSGLQEQQAELAKAASALYAEIRPWKLGDFLTEAVRFSSSLKLPEVGNFQKIQSALSNIYGSTALSIDQYKKGLEVALTLVDYSKSAGPIDWKALASSEVVESIDRRIGDIVLPEELGVESAEDEKLDLPADSSELREYLESSASEKRRIGWGRYAIAGTITVAYLGFGIVAILSGQLILGFTVGLSGLYPWIPSVQLPPEDKEED